jgi:HEAT repeat protein
VGDILDFGTAVRRLAEQSPTPESAAVYRLSSPGESEMLEWHRVWPELDPIARRDVARQLLASARADFQVDFTPLFLAMFEAQEPEVRAAAIDGLWERQDLSLMQRLLSMLRSDPGAIVRARSAAALGRYVELGQLDRLDMDASRQALTALIDAASDDSEDTDVRRRALGSAGYAGDPAVVKLIYEAIEAHERSIRAGALRAMGNSADERWASEVMVHLEDYEPELQIEAAHAAGELAVAGAVPALEVLACGDDRAVQLEAIWALGEIGGHDARRTVEGLLEEADSEDQLQALEDALATMSMLDGEPPWSDLDEPGEQISGSWPEVAEE